MTANYKMSVVMKQLEFWDDRTDAAAVDASGPREIGVTDHEYEE
jgi:hypothetical protein